MLFFHEAMLASLCYQFGDLHAILVQAMSEDATPASEDTAGALEAQEESRRDSSSSDGSLATLFFPPLPHERRVQASVAGNAATPRSQIRQSAVGKTPFSAGAAHGEALFFYMRCE